MDGLSPSDSTDSFINRDLGTPVDVDELRKDNQEVVETQNQHLVNLTKILHDKSLDARSAVDKVDEALKIIEASSDLDQEKFDNLRDEIEERIIQHINKINKEKKATNNETKEIIKKHEQTIKRNRKKLQKKCNNMVQLAAGRASLMEYYGHTKEDLGIVAEAMASLLHLQRSLDDVTSNSDDVMLEIVGQMFVVCKALNSQMSKMIEDQMIKEYQGLCADLCAQLMEWTAEGRHTRGDAAILAEAMSLLVHLQSRLDDVTSSLGFDSAMSTISNVFKEMSAVAETLNCQLGNMDELREDHQEVVDTQNQHLINLTKILHDKSLDTTTAVDKVDEALKIIEASSDLDREKFENLRRKIEEQKLKRLIKERDEHIKTHEEYIKETNKIIKKHEEYIKETNKIIKKHEEYIKETNKIIKEKCTEMVESAAVRVSRLESGHAEEDLRIVTMAMAALLHLQRRLDDVTSNSDDVMLEIVGQMIVVCKILNSQLDKMDIM